MTRSGVSSCQGLELAAARHRKGPADLLELAHAKWLAGERLDLGKLSEELSVGRASVFRWAGTRERLYGEVVWREVSAAYETARNAAVGLKGATLMASAARHLMRSLLESKPLQFFIQQDPAFAMRVLFSSESPVEQRLVAAVEQSLVVQHAEGHIAPAMDLHDLAFVLVRISESLMYRDVIGGEGEQPNVDAAVLAIDILVSSRAPASSSRRGPP